MSLQRMVILAFSSWLLLYQNNLSRAEILAAAP